MWDQSRRGFFRSLLEFGEHDCIQCISGEVMSTGTWPPESPEDGPLHLPLLLPGSLGRNHLPLQELAAPPAAFLRIL